MANAGRNRQPLYRQVAGQIRQAIAGGVWPAGRQLPSEPDLARRHGVSRTTMREALRVLEQEGIVRASRGQGNFVRSDDRLKVGINTLYSITEVIRRQGYTPSTTDVRASRTLFRDVFGGIPSATLPPDEPVVVIERTRRADGRPVVCTQDAVPLRLLAGQPWEDQVAAGSLFDILRDAGVEVDYARTRIYAAEAPSEAVRRLELQPAAPVLMTEETVYDRLDRPVVVSRDFYRTDWIEVMVIRTPVG